MDIDGSRLWCCLIAAAVVLAVHGCIAAAEAALDKIRPKVKSLGEKDKSFARLARQLEKPRRLEFAFMTEKSVSAVLTALLMQRVGWIALLPFLSDKLELDVLLSKILTLAGVFAVSVILVSLCNAVAVRTGRKNAEQLMQKNSRLIDFTVVILMPFHALVRGIDFILGGGRNADEESQVTEEDFLMMVDAGNETGLIEESQREMINNIIDFDDVTITNVMTHRTELVAVDVETKISDVVYLAINEGYSRMPVYEGNIDNIVGVLMVKDLLGLIGAEDISNFGVRHFMRPALFVPETAKCKYVLEDMLKDKAQMAVAVDEYGGTAGIVTMEDLLEEIVGSIRDEYDDEEIEVCDLGAGVYTIEGNASPEETLERLGIELPEGEEIEFDTMSAWLVELLGRIPDEDEKAEAVYGNVKFTVLLAEGNWISKIKAEVLKKTEQET
ncbi:MAG: hemolysin family protein [Ruminococcus sp.]